jgi:hypothetical protein
MRAQYQLIENYGLDLFHPFIDWIWTYFTRSRGPPVLDHTDAARINWQEDANVALPRSFSSTYEVTP